jgi:hypothetical protein
VWVSIERGRVTWEDWQHERAETNRERLQAAWDGWDGGPPPPVPGLSTLGSDYALWREADRAEGPDCHQHRDACIRSYAVRYLTDDELRRERTRLDAQVDAWLSG